MWIKCKLSFVHIKRRRQCGYFSANKNDKKNNISQWHLNANKTQKNFCVISPQYQMLLHYAHHAVESFQYKHNGCVSFFQMEKLMKEVARQANQPQKEIKKLKMARKFRNFWVAGTHTFS